MLFATLVVIPVARADSIVIEGEQIQPDGQTFVTVTLIPGQDVLLGSRRHAYLASPHQGTFGFLEVFKGPETTTVLSYTLTLANLSSPLVENVSPGGTCGSGDTCILGITFFVPVTYKPVSGTLTVHFNDETETFNFHYISNVPEPTSVLLLGTGIAAVMWRKFSQILRCKD